MNKKISKICLTSCNNRHEKEITYLFRFRVKIMHNDKSHLSTQNYLTLLKRRKIKVI